MKCPHCGLLSCGGGCKTPSSRPGESRAEREKRRRLERGDTLPDVEDEADDLLDIDEADEEVTRV
ncbi:MAG: hypothetical protein K0R38_5206 [Polyangiaceae bacterium]|jgi:hypothetical protein|nr:hypothetical protein [Polyangiaceae bacterium]